MISRSKKNEKSSTPSPENFSGGGCHLILDLVGQIPLLTANRINKKAEGPV